MMPLSSVQKKHKSDSKKAQKRRGKEAARGNASASGGREVQCKPIQELLQSTSHLLQETPLSLSLSRAPTVLVASDLTFLGYPDSWELSHRSQQQELNDSSWLLELQVEHGFCSEADPEL